MRGLPCRGSWDEGDTPSTPGLPRAQPSASAPPSALIKRSGAVAGERKQRAVVGPSCPVDGAGTESEIGRCKGNGDGWWPSLYATIISLGDVQC